MAITDGEDNNSRNSLNDLHYFEDIDVHLVVIGVGSSSARELRNLSRYATSTHSIDHFDDLFHAMSIAIEKVAITSHQSYVSFE